MRFIIAIVGLLLVATLVISANNVGVRYASTDSLDDAPPPFPYAITGLLVAGSLASLRLPTLAMAAFLLAGVLAVSGGPQLSGMVALVLAGLSFLSSRQKAKGT